jgi:lipopolysaccharide export system permease protein
LIIFRYLARDTLITTLAVSVILLIIFLSGNFSRYLDDAAQGKLAVDVLFTIIGFRMPYLLELILPLGFYLAILLVYGRLYMESEMVVLSACGMSQVRLIQMTIVPAALISFMVALLSFWLTPLGAAMTEQTLAEQKNRSEFDSLQEGRFQAIGQGRIMTYVESINDDSKQLEKVFVVQRDQNTTSAIIFAETGEQKYVPDYKQRYLVLHKGHRYEGRPGTTEFKITSFAQWARYLPPTTSVAEFESEAEAKSTLQLLTAKDAESRAVLQWRLSMPLMVFVVTLLAVPLSKTSPRQGRYLKMLPAIIIYILYLAFLINLRSAMTDEEVPTWVGLWLVHLVFFVVALFLINWQALLNLKPRSDRLQSV